MRHGCWEPKRQRAELRGFCALKRGLGRPRAARWILGRAALGHACGMGVLGEEKLSDDPASLALTRAGAVPIIGLGEPS